MDVDRASTRRTGAVRTQGRAARVVEQVLVATAEELGRVGFAALRVDDVASRSGVNKTTIYRRWPTRAELVAAAIRHQKPPVATSEAMSLRENVMAAARALMAFHASPIGRGILRVIQTEVGNPELAPVVRALRSESRQKRVSFVERAVRRGELPAGTDATLVADMIFAPVIFRMVMFDEPVDADLVSQVLETVLAGLPRPAPPRSTGRAVRPRSRRPPA